MVTHNVPTALRCGGERETNVSDSTKLPKREQDFKLNINPPFCKTDVLVAQLKYTNKLV